MANGKTLAENAAYQREYRQRRKAQGRPLDSGKKWSPEDRLRRYGLTEAEYHWRLSDQHHACAICKEPFGEDTPHIDHSHKTGEVRGVLCGRCNTGLGQFRDSPLFLQSAIDYLLP